MSDNRSKQAIQSGSKAPIGICVGLFAGVYLVCFLSFPLIEGMGSEGSWQNVRIGYVASMLLLPDMLANSWIGYGRLAVGILDRLPILLSAIAWQVIAMWIGLSLVHRADPTQSLSRGERLSISALIGLAVLSTTTLAIGLAGQLHQRWPLALSVLGLVAVSTISFYRSGARPWQLLSKSPTVIQSLPGELPSCVLGAWAARLVVVVTVLIAIAYALGSLMPPAEFDVVEYHLQAPKEFYQRGRIEFLPHNIYANMPLGVEMHALAAMTLLGGSDAWWTGGLIGKAVIGAHSLLAAWLLGSYVARCFDRWLGWVSAGLLLAAPGNAQVAMAGLIDSALGAYMLAAVIVLTHWSGSLERRSMPRRSPWYIAIGSLLAGAAAACKYPGLIYAVTPLIIGVAYQAWRYRVQRIQLCQWAIAMVVGLGLTCGAWYAKNAILARNPVYPLAYSFFGGRSLTDAKAQQWAVAHRVPTVSTANSSDSQALSSAYSAGALYRSAQQVLVGSPTLHSALIVFVSLGVVSCWRVRNWFWLWFSLSVWILAVWWTVTHRIDRFWLPILPLWAACASMGVHWLRQRVSHGLTCTILLIGLMYGALIIASPAIGDNRFFVRLSELRNDSGVSEQEIGRVSPALAWINEQLDASKHRVALIGEARVFDFRLPVVYSTCFDTSPIETWLRGKTPPEQLQQLRSEHITHMLINWSEINRYRSPGNYGFSDWPNRESIDQLIASGIAVREVNWPFDLADLELLKIAD